MTKVLLAAALLLAPCRAAAQDVVIERYVEQGLKNNLSLMQKEFSYRKSLEALSEARGMFMPSIVIEARYSRAGGGRIIDFPIGDLVNPVYSTLNQLLDVSGMPTQDFPALENRLIPFLREEEQDTKLRVVQPIFEPSVYYNYRIMSDLKDSGAADRDAFRRRLVADIKGAYFSYLKAVKIGELLDQTRLLLDENLRVSESLHRNGKLTVDAVYRARAELSGLEQSRAEIAMKTSAAASYFNFLLNRPLEEPIDGPSGRLAPTAGRPDLSAALVSAERRNEIIGLEHAVDAARNGVKLSTSGYLPSLVFVLDYGFEGEDYSLTQEDDYWMGSLIFKWNLFDGLQRKSKRDQAVLEKRMVEAKLEEARRQVRMQVKEAHDNLAVAEKAVQTAGARVRSASKSFEIIRRKFENGMSPHVEYLDARNTLTSAEVDLIVAQYDYHIRYAEFEWVSALNGSTAGQ